MRENKETLLSMISQKDSEISSKNDEIFNQNQENLELGSKSMQLTEEVRKMNQLKSDLEKSIEQS